MNREPAETDTVVRARVGQVEVDGRPGSSGGLTTAEREELTELRQRVKSLERERDMLQEATDFFAAQSKRSSDLWRRQRRARYGC
jgi:transposase